MYTPHARTYMHACILTHAHTTCAHTHHTDRYILRVEGMMGNEVVRKSKEMLKRKGETTLESLRDIKKQKRDGVKLQS